MMSSGRTSCAWLANRMFSQPNLVLDRRGELNVPDDMAKGMADALEATCIHLERRVFLSATPWKPASASCGGAV